MSMKKTMTEQLYRRRAGDPVQVWRVGDGEQPEWVGDWDLWHEYHGNSVVIRTTAGWKMQDATIFARDYEPLPAPAPDAREALEIARQALRKIAAAPTWRCPDKWETTPAALRLIAKDALARIGGGA